MKEKVVELLASAMWRDEEITPKNFEVAHHVNAILIDIISKVKMLQDTNDIFN